MIFPLDAAFLLKTSLREFIATQAGKMEILQKCVTQMQFNIRIKNYVYLQV